MAGGKRSRAKRKRVGLVLGAGGTLGAAWTIGGLAAVEERAVRQAFAAQLAGERCKVERAGTPVTVVMPGPADLTAIGLNLMDGRRREQVLRTAQVTVAAALRRAGPVAA